MEHGKTGYRHDPSAEHEYRMRLAQVSLEAGFESKRKTWPGSAEFQCPFCVCRAMQTD